MAGRRFLEGLNDPSVHLLVGTIYLTQCSLSVNQQYNLPDKHKRSGGGLAEKASLNRNVRNLPIARSLELSLALRAPNMKK